MLIYGRGLNHVHRRLCLNDQWATDREERHILSTTGTVKWVYGSQLLFLFQGILNITNVHLNLEVVRQFFTQFLRKPRTKSSDLFISWKFRQFSFCLVVTRYIGMTSLSSVCRFIYQPIIL